MPTVATFTIQDDEPVIRFATAQSSIVESAGVVTLSVARDGSTASKLTVGYTTRDGSARSGSDYAAQTGTITLAPGETTKAIIIPLLDDLDPELPESFDVILNSPADGARLGSPQVATVIIQDNEPAKDTFIFESPTYTVGELDGVANITVLRSPPARGSARVNFATGAASATAGQDFQTVSGTAYFGDGQTISTFSIPIIEDSHPEGDEALILTLSGPVSDAGNEVALGSPANALLTIKNAGNAVELASDNFFIREDNGFAHILVRRRGDTNQPFSVDFSTREITAYAGKDYLAQAGTLNFAAGQPTNGFTISILDNGAVDGSRSFEVALTNSSNGVVLRSLNRARVDILDNEVSAAVDLSFEPYLDGAAGKTFPLPDGEYIVTTANGWNNFGRVDGVPVNRVARLLPDGALDRTFDPGTSFGLDDGNCCADINAVVPQSDGKVLYAGTFTQFKGTRRPGLARLNADDSLDTTFNPAPEIGGNGQAVALLPDGRILVAMEASLFRLNMDGSIDREFKRGEADCTITSITRVDDGKIMAGGCFNQFHGAPRNRVARLNADGSLDTSFIPADVDKVSGNPFERLLAVQPDGKAILTGYSQNENGEQRAAFVRLNLDGRLDETFMGSTVVNRFNFSLIYSGTVRTSGKLAIAGRSDLRPDGASGGLIVSLEADGSLESAGRPIPFELGFTKGEMSMNLSASGFGSDRDEALLVGNFTSIDTMAQPFIARVDLGVTAQTTKLSLRLRELLASEGTENAVTILRRGDVSTATTVKFDARPAGSGLFPDFPPAAGTVTFTPLETEKSFLLPVPDNQALDAARSIEIRLSESADGVLLDPARAFVTIFDDEQPGSIDLSFDAGLTLPLDAGDVSVNPIEPLPDGRLRVWGNFQAVHGVERNGFAQLKADGTLDLAFTPVTAPPGPGSVQPDGKTFGYSNNRFVRFNTDGSVDATFSVTYDSAAQIGMPVALQSDGKLIVRGNFTALNGVLRSGLARLNPDGSADVSFDPGKGVRLADNSPANVAAIALQPNGRILIVGNFAIVGGVSRQAIARLNADGSLDESFTAEVGRSDAFVPNAWSLAVQTDGKVLALGAFPIVSPNGAASIARFNPDGSHDPTFVLPGPAMIVSQFGRNEGSIQTMALGSGDTLYVAGVFNRLSNVPRAGIVRINLGELPQKMITSAFISDTGEFAMTFRAQVGQIYRVETSDDLVNWTVLREVTGVGADMPLIVSEWIQDQRRFYRIVVR